MRSAPAAAACRKPAVPSSRATTNHRSPRRAIRAANGARSPGKPRPIETEGQAGPRPSAPVIIGVEAKAAMVTAQQRWLGLGTGDFRVPHQRAVGEDPYRLDAVAQRRDIRRHRVGRGEFGCSVEHLVFVACRRPLAVIEGGHYNPAMRRPTRFGLAVVALLLVLLGAYSAYW